MKKYKYRILKIVTCTIFLLIITSISNSISAYQIKHVLTPIEDNTSPSGYKYIYRKNVAAYSDTINKWNNGTYIKENGWAYATTNGINSNSISESKNFASSYTHSDANSFVRMYEYFHRNQNSSYSTTDDGTSNVNRYYATGTVSSTTTPQKSPMSYKQFWNVWRESDYYDGVYQNPDDIVKIDSNLYRFAIKDGIYISDNILDYDTILKIYNKFKDTNINGKTLTVYQSSVLRTNSANGGGKDNNYYQNIDTAWKAWETLIRGKRGWAWNQSPSTTGYKNGKINADLNIINYYDNTFEIPIPNITKNIVVRHIDVTGLSNINSNTVKADNIVVSVTQDATRAIQHESQYNWEKFKAYQKPEYINNRVSGTNEKYSENYKNHDMSMHLRIGNLKYKYTNYSTGETYQTVDTSKSLSSKERDILNNYKCIGAVVGKGETFEEATNQRNTKLNSINIRTVSDDNASYLDNTSGIIKLSDMTSVLVKGDEASPCIIIDFYYEKERDSEKKLYVRHVDVSDVETINASTINTAERLEGEGYIYPAPTSSNNKIYKDSVTQTGYQETYTLASGTVKGSIPEDPNKNYSCIGYNLVKTNDGSLVTVKNILDNKLTNASEKYEYMGGDTVDFDFSDGSDVMIVDFYYIEKNKGDLLKRPEAGRLSFYTIGDTDRFSNLNSINVKRVNNNSKYYDIIPSNETLRLSVDNAYTYMLGAINITEQQIKDKTFDFTYEITQEYTVKYKDWYASCPSHGVQIEDNVSSDGNYTCTQDVRVSCEEGDPGPCYDTCGRTLNVRFTEKTYDNQTFTRTVTFDYSIPYEYTYYKIKNMRFYTISKIDLYDGHNNAGLPLFDGEKHTVYPIDDYNRSFSDTSSFEESWSGQTVNRKNSDVSNGNYIWDQQTYTYTLSKTLNYEYNNEAGDLRDINVPYNYATSNVNLLLSEIDDIKATVIDKFDVTKEEEDVGDDYGSNYTVYTINGDGIKKFNEDDRLHAIFYVKNDEVSYTDLVDGGNIKLVGEGSSYIARKPSQGDISDEMNSIRFVDLYEYTKDSSSETANVSVKYPKSIRKVSSDSAIGSKYLPSDSLTTKKYFKDDAFAIPELRLNGKYYSYAKIYYNLLSNNNNLNFDVSDEEVNDKNDMHSWYRTTVSGPMGKEFVDTEMYNKELKKPTTETKTTLIKPGMLTEIVWEYGEENSNSKDVDIVDVFSPISFTTKIIETGNKDKLVDHTTDGLSEENRQIIQKNSRFTVEMNTVNNSTYSGINTMKYLGQYYIKFDFDVQDIIINDEKGNNRNYISNYVSSGEWIGPIYNKYGNQYDGTVSISAIALEDPNQATGVVNQESNTYEVRAVAANAPSSLLYDVSRDLIEDTNTFITEGQNRFRDTDSDNQDHQEYYNIKTIFGHSNYVAKKSVTTENVSRVYDFKVTDVKDLDWKGIFRKSTTTTTNVHSTKAYYSGINKWDVYTTNYNNLEQRTVAEIGATNNQILPVGPYKHTISTYTRAPKLGYRFSFDLKTTGANENKKVVIKPSYFYLSKDGTIFNEDIKLYYKNSSNRYVDISNYNIYFVPDDGYRLSFKESDYRFEGSTLKDTSINLLKNIDGEKHIVLADDMKQESDNGFVQIWYGEYKLPNSTIAVKKENGKYDINKNKLTNGYIGVKFDIKVYEATSETNLNNGTYSKVLSYSQLDNNASNKTNTSQWDYEGYLGFSNPGKEAQNLKLYLEKGTLTVNNDMYNKLKGTVMLYDADARASGDYE